MFYNYVKILNLMTLDQRGFFLTDIIKRIQPAFRRRHAQVHGANRAIRVDQHGKRNPRLLIG